MANSDIPSLRSEDGIFGKEAYATASTIANEAMSNIRTVASLNAEPVVSNLRFCLVFRFSCGH